MVPVTPFTVPVTAIVPMTVLVLSVTDESKLTCGFFRTTAFTVVSAFREEMV